MDSLDPGSGFSDWGRHDPNREKPTPSETRARARKGSMVLGGSYSRKIPFFGPNYFWDFGDGGFSFLNNPIHVYPKLGTYNVRLKALNNCGSVSLYDTIEVIYIPTGMADIDSSNIVIYPNPANENIRIDYDKELFVEFFNLSGTKVLESTENSINISELTKGTYIVLIKNREKKSQMSSLLILKE